MKKAYYFVYMTTNKINGLKYIGQHCTYNLEDEYLGSSDELNEDLKIYGKENFQRVILEDCKDIFDLAKKESYWQDYFNAEKDDTFYNTNHWNSPNFLFKHGHTQKAKNKMKGPKTEEHKRNMRLNRADISGEKNPMYGKKHSSDSIQKMKEGIKKKRPQKGKDNPMYGKPAWNRGKTWKYKKNR